MLLALLILAFSLGLAMWNAPLFLEASGPAKSSEEEIFTLQVLQALEDLKSELKAEKENLDHLMDQVEEIVASIEDQKEKLNRFLEEVSHRLKSDYSYKS